MTEIYDGKPLETGGTAMRTKVVAPPVRWLFEKQIIMEGMTVLDFGAGHGRNANWLRDQGCPVYAYDPFHGESVSGWSSVSNTMMEYEGTEFDIFLTSYVLNVIRVQDESQIIDEAYYYAHTQIHITRNKDLIDSVYNALTRWDKGVTQWYGCVTGLPINSITSNGLRELCNHGVKTSRGFQRDVHLRDYGFNLEHQTHGYKIFIK